MTYGVVGVPVYRDIIQGAMGLATIHTQGKKNIMDAEFKQGRAEQADRQWGEENKDRDAARNAAERRHVEGASPYLRTRPLDKSQPLFSRGKTTAQYLTTGSAQLNTYTRHCPTVLRISPTLKA